MKNKLIKIICLCMTLLLSGCNNADQKDGANDIHPISDTDTTFISYTELNAVPDSPGTETSGLGSAAESPKGETAISEKGHNAVSSAKTEFSGKTTEKGSISGEEPIIIYGTDNGSVDDDFMAAPGEIYLSTELKNAIKEYSDDPSVLFAVRIDVYDYNEEHIADTEAFLDNSVSDGLTYAEINERQGKIDEELNRLAEMSDIYINPDLTEEQSEEEYADRISELREEDHYYYETVMDMLADANIYSLQLESDRLAEHGIDICGITENRRNTNYITAIVSAEEINMMPFADDVGYKIWLEPEF